MTLGQLLGGFLRLESAMWKRWAIEVLSALSQFLNVVTFGDRDQTFSSRAYEAAVVHGKSAWKPLLWLIDGVARLLGERDHCRRAYEYDTERTYDDDLHAA